MPSRLNDQEQGAFIVIMQRVHECDLTGHILQTELGWTHLCLPPVYEAKHPFPIRTSVVRKSTGTVWSDPRKEGEALWPEKFSLNALQRMAKNELGSHMASGQLQQRPTAREGGLFKLDWFNNPVKRVPEHLTDFENPCLGGTTSSSATQSDRRSASPTPDRTSQSPRSCRATIDAFHKKSYRPPFPK